MNLLESKYSEKIDNLWHQIKPEPILCEYPPAHLSEINIEPRFAGMHIYQPAVGDLVFIVSGKADEYVLAHELMHVVLRREGYPHLTGRETPEVNQQTAVTVIQQLEAATLHPILNSRLSQLGIDLPSEYSEPIVKSCEQDGGVWKDYSDLRPYYFVLWPLVLAEILLAWNLTATRQEQLRKRNTCSIAWDLTDRIVANAHGIENAKPEQCRTFSLETVKLLDEHLDKKLGRAQQPFSKAIMFPPSPFQNGLDGPAKDKFKVAVADPYKGQWEIEVSEKGSETLCWVAGPFDSGKTDVQFNLVRTALDSLTAKDFADFCERLFSTIVF